MQDCEYKIEKGVLTIAEGVTVIERLAFKDNMDFEKLIMSDTVEKIEGAAFLNCKHLKEIVFSQNLREIGYNGFGSTAVKTLRFPDSLELIENYCFYGCSRLREVYFGKGIKNIGRHSFSCSSLKKAVFPKNSMIVPAESFSGCHNLEYLECDNLSLVTTSAIPLTDVVLSYLSACFSTGADVSEEVALEIRRKGRETLCLLLKRQLYDVGAYVLRQGFICDEDVSSVLSDSLSVQANAVIVEYLQTRTNLFEDGLEL